MKDLGGLVAMAAIKATIHSVVRRGIQSPLQFAKAEEKDVPWVMLGQLGGFVGDVAGGVAQTALGGGLKEVGGPERYDGRAHGRFHPHWWAVAGLFEVEGFGDELMRALTDGRPGGVVHLVLGDEGLVALGASVGHVDHEGLVRLVGLCGGDLDGLARFEGAPGVEGRGAMLWRDADGVRLSFSYELG